MLDRLFFASFMLTNLISLPVLFLWSLIGKNVGAYRGLWCRFQIFIGGIKYEYFGKPHKDARMYVMNHRSWLDILLAEAIISKELKGTNPCWIAKKELMKNLAVRAFMDLYHMIAVDRENKAGLVKLLKDVAKPIQNNRPIMIFPEGTRNKNPGLAAFKSGAKIIAERNSLLVQPIVYLYTDYALDTKNAKARRDKKVQVYFLDPINTTDKNWYETLQTKMQEAYNSHQTN